MRVYIVTKRKAHRVHHGMAGLILFGIGVALMLDDLADFPWVGDY